MSAFDASRPHNFYAGPSVIAESVLRQASEAVLGLDGVGLSVMEISHRSAAFEQVCADTKAALRELMSIPDTHEVLLLQGGARGQFAQLALNFASPQSSIAYVDTGVWTIAAQKEAESLARTYVLSSSASQSYAALPELDSSAIRPETAWIQSCSNNTVYGTQWRHLPDFPGYRHVCDMSSDILSRPVDVSRYSCIFAGAQKNAGPSGVTIVILDKAWMAEGRHDIPPIWQYRVQAKKDSMYNTPPTFPIYCVGLVAKWLLGQGGVEAIEKVNAAKAQRLYRSIEDSGGFYRPMVARDEHRSHMNVTWRSPSAEQDAAFVAEAAAAGLLGLKGHRLVGGLRASIYNQLPAESVDRLVTFMADFRARH